MQKIVLFGGVFDPIHIGHLSIYESIQNKIRPNKFIVVPSKNPPLKNHSPIASPEQRIEMCKIFFKKFKNVQVSAHEALNNSKGPSYTIDTVRYFQKQYPKVQLFFAMGTDRFKDFKKWKHWKELLTIVKLIVVKRNNDKVSKTISATFINIKPIPISSSVLRIFPIKILLTQPIANYIVKENLYLNQQVSRLMSKDRFLHTTRVKDLALDLAKHNHYKSLKHVLVASMYHDVAKELSDKFVLKLVGKYDHKRFPTLHTLHGLASAKIANLVYNIKDKEILSAIASHVIPPKNPSTLDMIIYCADKLEPKRTAKDIKNRIGLIKLARSNLKLAFKKIYVETQKHYQ